MSITSSFHYSTNPVNQCLCNFSTAASQKLVVSYYHLIISAVTDTVGLRHPLIFFCAVWQNSFYHFCPFRLRYILSSTLKWCQTAPNVTHASTVSVLHDIHMYTHMTYKCIAIIIGLTPAQAIRESLCSPIENLVTLSSVVWGQHSTNCSKKSGFGLVLDSFYSFLTNYNISGKSISREVFHHDHLYTM